LGRVPVAVARSAPAVVIAATAASRLAAGAVDCLTRGDSALHVGRPRHGRPGGTPAIRAGFDAR